MQYHVDGELVPVEEATVSVRNRGFMYGDAAFETVRVYGGEVFEWRAHADRLRRTCDALALDHGLSDDELRDRIRETLRANDLDDAYVKLSVSRGVQPGKLSPGPVEDPTVVVYVADLPRGGRPDRGKEPVWDGPATAAVVETRRIPDAALPAHAKTHNYLNGILARLELGDEVDEAVVLDSDGNLAEGATSNLFFVRDGVLHTPSLDGPILPGVTRRVVLELAESKGIPVEEGTYDPADLRSADEAFLTNSTWELRPLAAVEGTDGESGDDSAELGAGPVTERLTDAFDARVESEHYE
ncbi:aminotransferase class IV [Halorussus gelatinilyticus]|uniref:Aminotransferase class IV n=1 Tax=Halorussus gelatinilyticus TaxID=2937524 RepID=A0A8U0IDH3_9EURY|nr:aminotransferase class IV [Halorussus gelatinilyticus]UPV99109.1 aminotransferase class IV [Halorussus gelatinilyticus]